MLKVMAYCNGQTLGDQMHDCASSDSDDESSESDDVQLCHTDNANFIQLQ